MNIEKMNEEQIRKMYSGFIPDSVRARMAANREPSEDEIAKARALLAKVEGKRKPRAVEAAE